MSTELLFHHFATTVVISIVACGGRFQICLLVIADGNELVKQTRRHVMKSYIKLNMTDELRSTVKYFLKTIASQ